MLAAIAALSLAVATAEEPKFTEAAQKELKKFEGKWKAIKAVTDGNEETPEMGGEAVFVEFKSRKVVANGMNYFEIAAIDPSTDPKCIDLKSVIEKGPIAKGMVFEAIYKFDGDTLVMAIPIKDAKSRPAKFESEKDSGIVVITMKREKN